MWWSEESGDVLAALAEPDCVSDDEALGTLRRRTGTPACLGMRARMNKPGTCTPGPMPSAYCPRTGTYCEMNTPAETGSRDYKSGGGRLTRPTVPRLGADTGGDTGTDRVRVATVYPQRLPDSAMRLDVRVAVMITQSPHHVVAVTCGDTETASP